MKTMIALSLLLNIAVLIPVCIGLMTHAKWTRACYGETTPARGILLSVYLSILVASVLFLVFRNPAAVAALLLVQIIYKLVSPIAAGGFRNPVVFSNLGIALFHTITLWTIWQRIGNPFRSS
jgi:hypothetical protein